MGLGEPAGSCGCPLYPEWKQHPLLIVHRVPLAATDENSRGKVCPGIGAGGQVVYAGGDGEGNFAPEQATREGCPTPKADIVDGPDGRVDEGVDQLPIDSPSPHHHAAVGSGIGGWGPWIVYMVPNEQSVLCDTWLPTGQSQAGHQQDKGQQEHGAGSPQNQGCVCH